MKPNGLAQLSARLSFVARYRATNHRRAARWLSIIIIIIIVVVVVVSVSVLLISAIMFSIVVSIIVLAVLSRS
jgi:hypothetical protein